MFRRMLAASFMAALLGCQGYNFNPVGKCVIQPGSTRIQLSSLATADILFVVDDSGSMLSEQQRLASNFGAFITALAQAQADRKQNGLDAFDFHVAITTSSIFEAWQPTPLTTCGQTSASTCNVGNPRFGWTSPYSYACTTAGANCVELIPQYYIQGCSNIGLGAYGAPYPAGNFVAAASVDTTLVPNPRVLHFTKDLAWETWNTPGQDPKITALVKQFQQNINVGTCGSGMEQHLEGGRLAVEKAIDGSQPGVTAGEWPHPGAKLVVVWVGDEDDCSNPDDPNRSLAFTTTLNAPGNDVCTQDEANAAAGKPFKMFPVGDYVDYFTGLGRPFSAAFIYSAVNCRTDSSGNMVCDAGLCSCQCPPGCSTCGPTETGACQTPADCSGKSTGSRFHDLSAALRDRGVSTLDASVCDYDFAKTLTGIAELVKPPSSLTLPTQPASSQVAVVVIQDAAGNTVRQCTGPGAGQDWSFVDCRTAQPVPDGTTSTCIAINHATSHCEANPGESYVAQYLGIVPQPDANRLVNPIGGCALGTPSDCSDVLGGTPQEWTCQAVPGWTPVAGQTRGTCLCASP